MEDTMTNEARAFLDQLDEIALKNDQTSKDIFAVLTALRSHDVRGDGPLKAVTTIPIRRAALPKLTAAVDAGTHRRPDVGMDGGGLSLKLDHPSDDGRVDLRDLRASTQYAARRSTPTTQADRHFGHHAEAAGKALGLTVIR